jgi:hypothetical protein
LQEVTDVTSDSTSNPFAAFAPEVPSAGTNIGVLAKGALLVCAVDMFRVDMPLMSPVSCPQDVYTRVIYALFQILDG